MFKISVCKFLYFGSKSENYLKFLLEYSIDCIQLTNGIKIEQIINPNIVNLSGISKNYINFFVFPISQIATTQSDEGSFPNTKNSRFSNRD